MTEQQISNLLLTGAIVFVAIWVYAFSRWGFLKGLSLGWIPAVIGALVAMLLRALIISVALPYVLSIFN